ncbi:MAG TPA: protein-glutamine glutaminase family protein [Chitinophagales bacterium]|nr:protein-glutamine glutaminase family protein [Chitinophagales bacterium]
MKQFTLLTIISLFIIMGCNRINPDAVMQETLPMQTDYKLMTLAYYTDAPDNDAIWLRFYETPRIIPFKKNAEGYEAMKALLDVNTKNNIPLRVTLNTDFQMTAVHEASDVEKKEFEKRYQPEGSARTELQSVIPDIEDLHIIFDYMRDQGCATGLSELDYCIPFQYVVDGCYARAHKMRQVLAEKYGFDCQKVFSYEDPSAFLAVNTGECCVYWWYHVAPLVTVWNVQKQRIEKYVIDPSMFDTWVTIEQWTGAQEDPTCSDAADFGYSEITPSAIYSPGGGTDATYYYTNWTLSYYADLVTCD